MTNEQGWSGAYTVVFGDRFDAVMKKLGKKDRNLLRRIEKQVGKIVKDPALGKPLRNVLKNNRRVHIGSFVLVYEIASNEIRFLDFDHHDKIYNK